MKEFQLIICFFQNKKKKGKILLCFGLHKFVGKQWRFFDKSILQMMFAVNIQKIYTRFTLVNDQLDAVV